MDWNKIAGEGSGGGKGPWLMKMKWRKLLFLHWRVDPILLQSFLPPGLRLDLFNDQEAYLGVVPFTMEAIAPRYFPFLETFVGDFQEINLRTYVIPNGETPSKPGVYFFTLDCNSFLSVIGARMGYGLPYYQAEINTFPIDDGLISYQSKRSSVVDGSDTVGEFDGSYRVIDDESYLPEKGTLEYFLTERYCLYLADGYGRIMCGHINHAPWKLKKAEAFIKKNTLSESLGMPPIDSSWVIGDTEPIVSYCEGLDVVAWWLEQVNKEAS